MKAIERYTTRVFLLILLTSFIVVKADKAINEISETFEFIEETEVGKAPERESQIINSAKDAAIIKKSNSKGLSKKEKSKKGSVILNSLPKKKKSKAQDTCNCNSCKQCKKCNTDNIIINNSSHQVGNTFTHSHTHSEIIDDISRLLYKYLYKFFMEYPKEYHQYLACGIISFIPIPILIFMLAFGIQKPFMLNLLTAFSLGALLGDVIFHNIVHIMATKTIFVIKDISFFGLINLDFLFEKEMFIIHGVILMIAIEKFFQHEHNHSHDHDEKHEHKTDCKSKEKESIPNETKDKTETNNKENKTIATKKENHAKNHDNSKSTMYIAFTNDFIHNFTDGIALASLFKISTRLGISSLVAMILHEIPHELADFSFLLKKKKSIFYCIIDQLLAASGAFLGVFLSSYIDDKYSLHMLSLISGMFLYFCLNTLANEIKEKSSMITTFLQLFLLILGVHLMKTLI